MATAATEYTCGTCGRTFASRQALGGHVQGHRKHADRASNAAQSTPPAQAAPSTPSTPRPPRDFSPAARAQALLTEVSAPIREALREVNKRIDKLTVERAALIEERNQYEGVLRRVEGPKKRVAPTGAASTGNAARQQARHEARVEAVLAYIANHPEDLQDGFTTTVLLDGVKRTGGLPMTVKTGHSVMEELRTRGIIRADRVVRGGGMSYQLVSNHNGKGDTA